MEIDIGNVKAIALILTVGFGFACVLGYLSLKLKLSPILGYLVAGYLIGPYSPGFVADVQISEQLAEIGVILMMFGVGIHFKWQDLVGTRNIAVPGAIGQILVASTAGILLIYAVGWGFEAGIVFGMAISVASTMVLVRVLTENKLLKTPEGLISVGWLVVEDIITVLMLLFIPILAASKHGAELQFVTLAETVILAFVKFSLLVIIMFTVGKLLVRILFKSVSKLHSHELFTLTILALTFAIATSASLLFGLSTTLGAFIAGMVIGHSGMHRPIITHTLPLQDAFVVIFFLTAGMLFNPEALFHYPWLFLGTLAVILILKPLTAFAITTLLKHPYKTSLIIAMALAQIGEFSFILAEESMKYDIIPDEAFDVLVGCALISLAINPSIFKSIAKHLHIPQEVS